MQKKPEIHDKTKAKLNRAREEKEKLSDEINTLKQNEGLEESQQKSSLVLKFFKCANCSDSFNSSDELNEHMIEHAAENPSSEAKYTLLNRDKLQVQQPEDTSEIKTKEKEESEAVTQNMEADSSLK